MSVSKLRIVCCTQGMNTLVCNYPVAHKNIAASSLSLSQLVCECPPCPQFFSCLGQLQDDKFEIASLCSYMPYTITNL